MAGTAQLALQFGHDVGVVDDLRRAGVSVLSTWIRFNSATTLESWMTSHTRRI